MVPGDVRTVYTYLEDGDILFAEITPCVKNGKSIARGLLDGI